jgi:glycosyltransferase involved in cell wall biosynthesis
MLAGGGADAAEAAAIRHGATAVKVITASQIVGGLLGLRTAVADLAPDAIVAHASDWSRQPAPQLFEAALATLPCPTRLLIDDRGTERTVSRAQLLARVGADGATALPLALGAATGLLPRTPRLTQAGAVPNEQGVLGVWRGAGEVVGGSATHISGILGGFRDNGFAVDAIVGGGVVPPQLARVAGRVEVPGPLPARLRMLPDLASIWFNRQAIACAVRLGAVRAPSFVYQRNAAFLDAGVDIARLTASPLVLEWNGSAIWSRENWETVMPAERIFDRRLRAMQRRVLDAATLVVSVSEAAADLAVQEGADESKVIVVPNGVDLAAVRPADHVVAEGPARVGWIGSFGPWHGAEVLIEAVARLRNDVRLVMVGDGVTRPEAQALAARLGIADKVEWLGRLPHEDAVGALRSCDLLASPHVPLGDRAFFGSPTKVFEYMAIGLPIVASRLGQIGDVLVDGETAVMVDPGDATSLAGGIDHVVELPDRGRALGARARSVAEREHGWDRRSAAIVSALALRTGRS